MKDKLAHLIGCPYWIMDGAGNDFVIVDLREGGEMKKRAAKFLGDREGPFGCDQIITIETRDDAPFMGIFNADGSEAGACGNATRCFAHLLMEETNTKAITFGSPSGPLHARRMDDGEVEVDMGAPRLGWEQIPLSLPIEDTSSLPIEKSLRKPFGVKEPVGVSMGNPHAVFFVEDADAIELEKLGPLVEHHPLFPDRVNCTVASQVDDGFRLRTWERGVGITRACGTAACATLVAAKRKGLSKRKAKLHADGGVLSLHWEKDSGHLLKAGPVRLHRRGTF